jgi:hypothetical protein
MSFASRSIVGGLAMLIGFAVCGDSPRATAQNNKKRIPRAQAVADTLKSDLDNLFLRLYVFPPKEKPPSSMKLVTPKKGEKAEANALLATITKEEAAGLVDRLLEAGVFDELIPPLAGIAVPGWYLQIGIADARPKYYIWAMGATSAECTRHPAVNVLRKALKGDAKAGLEKLLDEKR